MAASRGRSPLLTYLVMGAVAVVVVVVVSALTEPATQRETSPEEETPSALPPPESALAIERDFLTTVLGRPRVAPDAPYCDARSCCSTRATTFGTTAPIDEVIQAFQVQGYFAVPGDRDIVRPGPFPSVRWTAELDYGGRWAWRRVEVARGPDLDRPAWPTVFVQSSVACGEG